MHTHHHPTDDHGDSNIADENIQRLLASAYHPETPDKVFVQRLTATMASVARERAEATSARLRTRPRARIGWAVAASVLVAAGGLLGYVSHGVFRKPVADAVDPSRTPVDGAELPVRKTAVDRVWPIRNAIVAAPRMPVDLVPVLSIGERLRTGPSERRRVPLPDGSLVYVNQNSALKLQADRQLLLERGEIYVEVAASAANGPDPDQPGAEPAAADEAAADTGGSRVGTGTGTGADATVRERFVVTTPNRELIALGTRFNVRASERQTAVAVTQGKVQVSGLDRPLRAGEQLAAMDGEIEDSRVTRIGQAAHLIDWTRELLVAAESPLVPVSHYAGGALVATLPDGQETRLSMRRYHVDVHLEDGFARTTIDQTYFNHKSSRLEGTFFFPLPPDASLSRLAMYVNGQLMEGGMAERDHARQVFETIVNRQKDPALLEWIDGSTFRMRVFPLEGRQEKRIVLSYTQRLPRLGQRLQYRFPGGHSMPQVDHWTCQLRACGAAGCRWEADNYEFQETREGRDLVLRAAAEQIRPDRSLVVRMWDPDATERDQPRSIAASPAARFATVRHEGHRYLSLSCPFRPELPPRPRRRDWAFLFEASADRDPVLARTQIEIIKTLLENAEHEDTFVLLAAGTRVHAFADQPLPATPRNVKRAVRFLEATHLVGALDLENALRVAAASLDGAENPWLVQLGSGYPRLGEKSTDTLTALVDQRTRYVGVAVGNQWNRQWMQAAASRSAGHVTQINPDEAVHWRSIELLSRLNAPRLSGIRVNDQREALRFLTAEDFVCQDDELFAVARLGPDDPLPKSLEVTGSIDGKPYVQKVRVSDVVEDAGYLPRTWAKLEIDRLVAADPLANRDAIVRLSMAMYVMSPFTSLLVLENEQMYEEFKVDRGRKDHWALYACPERIPIVHEPLKSPAAESVPKPDFAESSKPTIEQVLQTILVRTPAVWGANRQRSISVWQLGQRRTNWYAGSSVPLGWRQVWVNWEDSGAWNVDFSGRTRWRRNATTGNDWDRPVPALQQLPYVNRLFQNAGIGRESQSLMMMVTPRIIIQEEEEPWFGLDFDGENPNSAWRMPSGVFAADRHIVLWEVPGSSINLWGQPFYPWTPYNHSTSFFLDRKALSQASPSSLPRLLSEVYPVGDLVLPITPVSFSADGDRLLMGGMDGVSGMGRGGNPNWVWTAFANGVVRGNSLPLLAEPTLPYWNQAIWAELADHRRAYRAIDLANDPLHLGGLRLATAPNPTATAADASRLRSTVQDLLAFAPGMETTQADVLAVVEREAQRVNSAVRSKIDRAAKRLIERARSGGWSQVEVPRAADAALQVRFDLSGRHQIVGRTPYGLHEEILCDGQRLWHLYSDLGIGSRREYSRFHRQALSRWIPWLLPPAEELADGADVVSLDPHTVAVVPHRSETSSDRPADTADFPQMLLVFDDEGRLTERHWVTGSDRAVVIRETYGVDGTVQRRDGEGRLLRSIRIPVTPCKAPDLAPDDCLVVLPLPWRTREHVIGAADLKDDGVFDGWSRSDALAVLGAETAAGLPSMRSTISWCFLDERDPRLGFYVLMLAAGVEWPREQDPEPGESRAAAGLFTALEQGPGTPLAGYLDAVDRLRRDDETSRIDWSDKDKRSFASALAGLHDLCADWRDASGKPLLADSKLERRTIRYLLRRPPLPFAAKLLATVRQTGDAESFLRILDGTQQAFPGREPTAYLLRLVHARAVAANETGSRGQELFVALTGEMLESGCVPLLDSDIRETFFSGPGGSAAWNALVTQISERVLQAPSNPTALEVARRLHELSGEENAERIFSAFAAGNSAENQLAWTLLAVAYLDATSQHARAGAMLASLLADDRWRGHAGLWRLAAAVAKNGGAAVPAAMHLDRALELEYVQRAGEIDLKRFRQEYRQLLEYWAQAGDSLAGAGDAARQSLEGSVVRAADRWREIDPAVAEPCSLAADALARVGAVDLAWDYLTTLLADGSSESPDWHDRGRVYHRQGAFDLAVRAYGLAAEDHPENAEILWHKAQALGEGGYPDAARAILRDIAEGSWAPEYAWISDQARRAIESPADSEASP